MNALISARLTISPYGSTFWANTVAILLSVTKPALSMLVILPLESKVIFCTNWSIRLLVWLIADECSSTVPFRLLVAVTRLSIFSAVTWKLPSCLSKPPSTLVTLCVISLMDCWNSLKVPPEPSPTIPLIESTSIFKVEYLPVISVTLAEIPLTVWVSFE